MPIYGGDAGQYGVDVQDGRVQSFAGTGFECPEGAHAVILR